MSCKSLFKSGLLLALAFLFFMPAPAKEIKNSGKVLVFVSQSDFRDEEYFKPKKIFTKAGFEVVTVSNTKEQATGMLGAKIMPDMALSSVKSSSEYAAIVIVGGNESMKYIWWNKPLMNLIEDFEKNNKVISGIGQAQVVIAQAGLLEKKLATVTNIKEAKDEFVKYKVKYIPKDVVISGNIVTAEGPQTSSKFGKTVLKLLAKEEKR